MPTDRDRSVVEELRQRILELKEALDNEKAKTKQIQHDKVAEIKHIKEQETLRYEQEKISLKKKYLKEKNGAVNKILESLKKKDRGVGEILQQKEDEIRCLHEELQKERDSDIRSTSSHATEGHLEEARDQWEMEKDKLMKCMFELRSEKLRLEEDYELLKDSDRDKAIMLRQMDDQKQKELQALKRQSALENRKQMEEIRSIERKVMDKEKEISRKSKRLSLIECSKEELQDKLNEQKLSERVNLSMSMIDLNSSFSPKKSADDKERGLQQRNSELQARIKTLEDRCSAVSAENEGLRHSSASPSDKKASVLELQVKQLAAEKRALEEKLLSSNQSKNQTSDGHPLEDKMRLQEKEKLAIERTLAQILQHNNIKLPPALKENIENQALQFELNDAVAEKEDNEVLIALKSKVSELESACATLRLYNSEFTEREAQLKNVTKQLDSELKTIKEDNLQLVKQLTDARDTLKSLSHENHKLKAEIDRKMPLPLPEPSNDKAVKQTHDLKNEIIKLTAEKQRLLDAEETAKSKIKLLEEVQMQLVKKEEQNGRYYDEVSQKLSLITKEKKELTERVQEYEAQRRFEAEEMASMLNDRNDYLKDLEKREKSVQVIKQDKEYLRKECETYRISNLQLEQRLQKMQKQVNPNSAALIDRITELEENNEVIENLKASTEGLKEHIKKLEAEKVNTKKQHNEELQRVIRTLDKKNKEHVQKSEELRAHIKRLDSDLRNLERSKMENSGNLQIKAQELQQMSEYVKKLETSEHELHQRLEAYQKSTVNESEKYQSRIRELELNTKKMSDMKQTERVLRRHIIEIDKARASEARQHHRAKLQLEEMEKKMSSCAVLMERAKEVEPLVQEVTMLKASESRLKEQLKSISEGNNVSDSIITESQSKDDELHKLYDQIKSLNKKMEDSSTMIEANESLKKKITQTEAKFKESRISLEAQLARQDIAVADKTKQVTESLALIARLQKQVAAPADSTTKRNLLEKIVALEEEAMKAKSESSRLQTVVEQNMKMTVPCSSVELSDGTYSAAQSDLHTKVTEQGEELQTLHKTLLAINKGRMKAFKKRDADQGDDDSNVISLQNIDSLNFIIKENMTLGDLMQNLNNIYERDMSKLNDEKKAALQAVEDMKSTMLESKLSEVENEFSNYPAALSLELRNLNNKLALSEDNRRNLNVEMKMLKDQITNKSSEGVLMQTRLNDAERQLHNASDGRQQRQSQADKDQAEGRHKSVKHKLQAEIELLESSLETAHGTIKALQTQGSPENSSMIKKVQETHTQINQMKAQYRNQISELEQTLANQSADMMKRDKDIKLLNEQINQLHSRMGRVSGSKDQDILALTQERDLHIATKIRLEQQNTELIMLCENIKGDFEKQTYTLTDLKKSRDNVQHELEGKELEIQNLNTKLHAYEEKITSLRTQLSSTTSPDNLLQSKEEQICDLEEKLNNTSEKSQAEISRIKADLWKVQTDLTTERAAKVSAEASVAELRLKYDNCNSSYQRELESSQSHLSTTKAQLMSLTDQHDILTTRTGQLQKQVKELEYDIESKTRELREVKSRTSELDKTVKQRNEEIGNLMKKTAAMEKEVSMRRNASDVNSELSDLLLNKDNHINSLEERLKSTKEDILESKARVSKLQEQLKRSEEERQRMSQEARQLQNSVAADNNAEREALQQRNEDLNKEISRLATNLTQAEKGGDEALIARVREADAERVVLTESLQRSTETLDTKDRELSTQKSEIQTLKATLDGHSNRLHEQASVIDRLQAELTDVKGTMAGSLLDDIHNATYHSIPRVTLEPSDSIELADDDVSDALRTIDEANMAALGAACINRSVTADSEAKYYVALFDYAPIGDYGELALKEGDMVIVLGDEHNGHYLAEVGGKKGLVPTNYVEEYSAKRPGSTFPLEAYKQSAVVLDDLVDLPSPPLTPSAEWLPNSSVCISWVPPVISGGKSRGVDVAGYKVYQRGMEKTIIFGAENTEIILENMSSTSLGEFEIVTLGRGSEESIRIPISIPRPPQKAEVLKVVQGQSTGQSMDVGSTYVLALYDYTPHEQSPNEFPELELPFKEGDLLKVLGDKMDDGFFEGELNGVTGLVPSNFVQSVLDGTNGTFESDEAERRNFVALYDYNPFEMSPNENPESELTFYEGDIIIILGGMDQDGFYPGELNGIQGLVPSNFVEEAKPARNGRNYLSLPREDSTEAAIAQLLSEAASNVHNDPVKNNVPSSAETDVRTGLSVRWQGRY